MTNEGTNLDRVITALDCCQHGSLSACDSCPYHYHKEDGDTDGDNYRCTTMFREAKELLEDIRSFFNSFKPLD